MFQNLQTSHMHACMGRAQSAQSALTCQQQVPRRAGRLRSNVITEAMREPLSAGEKKEEERGEDGKVWQGKKGEH